MLQIGDLPHLSREDIRTYERGRAAAALVMLVLVSVLAFTVPDAPAERHASAGRNPTTER